MSRIWRSVVTGVAIAAAAQAAQAGVIWNGSEYGLVDAEGISWTSANAAVAAMGGGWHLATITSAAENDFVEASLLPASPVNRSHYWLGATDAASEGSFLWLTGEPFSFTDWAGDEPNNSGNEDYLAYDFRSGAGWAWNDAPDNLGTAYGFARGYVIERRVGTPVPLPGVLPLLGIGLGLIAARTVRRARV